MINDLNVFDVFFAQCMIRRGNQVTWVKCDRNEPGRVIICFAQNDKSLRDYNTIMEHKRNEKDFGRTSCY